MKVFKDLNKLPLFRNAVVTIGSFDGVHQGHRKIIEKVRQLALNIGGESVLITFHPHPRQVVYPKDDSLRILTTIEEKIHLLEELEIDNVVVVPFTVEFSQLSADEYIEKFLVGKFHPRYIVIGYDHRFGLGRQGDIDYLQWHGKKEGFDIVIIDKQEVENIAVSSTKIRRALEQADIPAATRLLDHYFPLSGTVVRGQSIGKQLGFPTANLEVPQKQKLIPPNGVYAVFVTHQGRRYRGMLYIGRRPTLEKHNDRTIEVNIFDFNENIYGDELQLEIVGHLRGDVRFDNLQALRQQLEEDRKRSESLLRSERRKEAKKKKHLTPAVAIVILNYNGREYLRQFLPTVMGSTYPNLEVYVADNGSQDGSLQFLEGHLPEVKKIDLLENHGFAEGYNLALQVIRADYYVLLNSDVEVTPGWMEPVIEHMERHPAVAACQPKIKSFLDKDYFEYAGASGGWLDGLGYPFCRGRIFSHVEEDLGQYDDAQEIFWASGAALFVRARLFHDIGGFDKDYFAHSEEIDLCWRLKRAGYKVMALPESEVYHVGGGTLNYQSPFKTYLNFRNTLYSILKNEESGKLLQVLLLRLLLDGAAGVLFLFQGKFTHIGSIVKAHWTFFFRIPALLDKRRYYRELIDGIRITGEASQAGRYPGSIVWQYYALGKRKFRQLSR